MAENTVVRVNGLNKKFNRDLKGSFTSGIRTLLGGAFKENPTKLKAGEFWALRNINLELKKGESLGLVGVNGSGKTTLLRLIAGVINPTSGTIETRGKIAPMLALGAGFEPSLSGSQNVYLNMSLLGMTTDEIRARYDEVVDFAEIGESIDAPLGTYSTGMRMRLGFACAVHTDPQLLIVDEVLAVGDANFRVKCRNKINDIRKGGASLILVSHSRLSVEYLTDRAIYLQKGQVLAEGDSKSVLDAYEADQTRATREKLNSRNEVAMSATSGAAGKKVIIEQVRLLDNTAHEIEQIFPGEDLTVEVTVTAQEDLDECAFNVMFKPVVEPVVYHPSSTRDELGWIQITKGRHTVRIKFDPVIYLPGLYSIRVNVSQGSMMDILCHMEDKSVRVLRPAGKIIRSHYIPPLHIDLADLTITELDPDDMDFEEAEDL
ncbi:ABC transporter ATP-binding protein [Rhizobium ruizarguesonis]|uniref:ABC transporter ATP-binding protein n=1 Tax=Rhizobium ruizarguesonis TaxID=2081791 RepID=UPI001030B7C6|nr:ABC transporter ATP-binding protein [Rhizobium ruizarguesonis]TBD19907.1 ABC transporter ATP-binding protein [Rhizobium ruizarguesonis]